MRKCFFTGLALLLPIVMTVVITVFLVNLLTNPFQGMMEALLDNLGVLDHPFLFWTAREVLQATSKILILFGLFALVILVGTLVRVLFLHYFFKFADYLIHKIPVINKIYKATQEVVRTLFDSEAGNFSHVVLAPFPYEKSLSLGLVTNGSRRKGSDMVSVFVPAAPNPTMGFMLMYKREKLTYLDMTVEEGLKVIVSCGVLFQEVASKNPELTGLDEEAS